MPTFVGCPALLIIEEAIVRRVRALPGVDAVRVNFVYEPAWSVDRISDAGRAALKAKGITVPQRSASHAAADGGAQRLVPLTVRESTALAEDRPRVDSCGDSATTPGEAPVACPWCGATDTQMESAFGPTRCKMIYYCAACRNSFEHMKRV